MIPSRPAIAAGSLHTLGLKADGTVLALGDNSYGTGQTNVGTWTDIVAIAAGGYNSLGLRSNGTVRATGWNNNQQSSVTPWSNIIGMAAGDVHSIGLRKDGTAVAASDVLNRSDVSGWSQLRQIAASETSSIGLRSNGTVLASSPWCDILPFQYGSCQVAALSNVVQVAAGYYHVLALFADGTVAALGTNYRGVCSVSNWNSVVQIAAGDFHSVGLRSDGTVVATGDNRSGACDVSGWSNIVAISANENRTVGLKADDTVVAAGTFGNDVAVWYLGTNQIAPIITEPPLNQTALIARPTVLRATAAGPGNISYQWLKDGIPITDGGRVTGATTRALSISNVQFDDTAGYSIIAANTYGATTSSVGRLEAVLPPAISIGPNGTGLLTFDELPAFGHWFTYSRLFEAPYSTTAQLDAAVQLLNASAITNVLSAHATLPPQTDSLPRWNSAGRFLQLRPAGVRFTALMGTFQNDTAHTIEAVYLSFEVATYNFQIEAALPGLRVYFSTSAAANSWEVIPGMAGVTSGPVSATLSVQLAPAERLYVLWADNNTDGVTDPSHTIDNLTLLREPRLNIRRLDANRFEVTWSAALSGYVLEAASTAVPFSFQPVSEPDTPDAQFHHVIVTNVGTRFFRLSR